MNTLNDIENIYFLGIGGIGMSALAQYFFLNGKNVSGYDLQRGNVARKLEELGIAITYVDDEKEVPRVFQENKRALVVYTPAIPEDLTLLTFFRNEGFTLKKRAEVLGWVTEDMPTLAVAGTHGKTTTSTILAHLLKVSGYEITAFLGGISENYGSNFIGDGKDCCVVEADEFDRSFLQLSPDFSGITAMDPDHLDVYGDQRAMERSFEVFANKVKKSSHLFHREGLPFLGNSVGFLAESDYQIHNIRIASSTYRFDFKTPEGVLEDIHSNLPGRYNLLNTGMAIAMALKFGADPERIGIGVESFCGVKRRFTYHLKGPELFLIEDYAHHPREIEAVYEAARELFPGRQLTVIFQPHLYSRTRDFAKEFAESLNPFDEVFLLPIYPARELPIPGIDSEYLLSLIQNKRKEVVEKENLPELFREKREGVILMLGAGDIGEEAKKMKRILSLHED